MLKKIIITLGIIFIAIQFYPVNRENPPFTNDLIIEDIKTADILKRSCYDCHSSQTSWPWYSYIAPVSWLVSDDVVEGRKELNFNEYQAFSAKKKKRKLEEIKEEIKEGKMPLDKYLWTHPNAELTVEDQKTIFLWVDQELSKIPVNPETEKIKSN